MNKKILLLIAAMMLSLSTFAANIETDRAWYLAGEAMRVSITIDDAVIAYAELCDTYSLAAGTIISVKEGKGTGIIELPATLHSGYYVLSVYTRHNSQVSQQLVAIVNPIHKSADDDIEWVKTTYPDSLSYPTTDISSSLHLPLSTIPVDEREVENTEEEKLMHKLVKAADKIAAYIKCLREESTGNAEFAAAKESTGRIIREMHMPEVDYFMDHFVPSYGYTLDKITGRDA